MGAPAIDPFALILLALLILLPHLILFITSLIKLIIYSSKKPKPFQFFATSLFLAILLSLIVISLVFFTYAGKFIHSTDIRLDFIIGPVVLGLFLLGLFTISYAKRKNNKFFDLIKFAPFLAIGLSIIVLSFFSDELALLFNIS